MQQPAIHPVLAAIFATQSLKPFTGLDLPLESTLLFPVHAKTGQLVMSWSSRTTKGDDGQPKTAEDWALVGGKAESIYPGEKTFSDFRPPIDARLIKDGKQLSADEQGKVETESPIKCLIRETTEEITGKKNGLSEEDTKRFDWLASKIQKGVWTCVRSSKDGEYDKVTKASIKGFGSYTCLCRVDFTDDELARLNNDIAGYPNREHQFFRAHPWAVKDVEIKNKDGSVKLVPHVVVAVDNGEVRKYNRDIMFKFYKNEISELLTRKQ